MNEEINIKEFKELETAIIEEYQKRLNDNLLLCETEEGLKKVLNWEGKTYKGDVKTKLIKYITKKNKLQLNQDLTHLYLIENTKDNFNELVITIDWFKSKMWGSNPRSYTNFGFEGSSIGGCGYDKRSTATAEALNSYKPLLRLLYKKKNDLLKLDVYKNKETSDINRNGLGYGSGYSILPRFEGGVGVSSHIKICEGLGLKWESHTQAKQSDIYIIREEKV